VGQASAQINRLAPRFQGWWRAEVEVDELGSIAHASSAEGVMITGVQ
jgi:hypothetical protein